MSAMPEYVLPFERKLVELAVLKKNATSDEERYDYSGRFDMELASVYSRITPWQRVELARHPLRPRMLDYVSRVFEDFVELHGDRAQEDDPAMVCGMARFRGQTVFVVGQQKGADMEEKVRRNFGMPHPSGYRKAMRVIQTAERLGFPVITFVDTPAAHPGVEAERSGQGFAIAENLMALSGVNTPILSVVIGEGGSGGAIAIAVADWLAMFEYACYMICPPERCAEILWRDADRKDEAASALKMTAGDLKELGIIDNVLSEFPYAAHHDPDAAAAVLAEEIAWFLEECKKGRWKLADRQRRYERMGQWLE